MKKGLLVLLISIIFTSVGFLILYVTKQNQEKTKDYITTYGVVVDYREDWVPNDTSSRYDDYEYAPIVEYEVDGRIYTIYSDEYSTNPPYIGSPISVSYDPNNPNNAVLERTKNNVSGYIGGILFIIVGPLIGIVGIVAGVKDGKKRKSKKGKNPEKDLSSESYYEGLNKL